MESSTRLRKLSYWLLSAIAATIVGYYVLQMLEKKPNIDSTLYISDAGEKGYEYKLTLYNTGPISIRNIRGVISLRGTQNVEDVQIRKARSHINTNYKVLPKEEEYLSVVEFTASAFDPSEKSGSHYIYVLDVYIYCDSADVYTLHLYADGLRYRHTWRPWTTQIGDDSELIIEK